MDDGGAFRFQHLSDLVGDALLVGHAEDDNGLAVESEKTHASPLMSGPPPMSAMATTNSVRRTFWPFTLTEPFMIKAGASSSTPSTSRPRLAPAETRRARRALRSLRGT